MNVSRRVPVRPAPESPGPPRYARVLFDFKPSVREELQLDSGDIVKILWKVDDFWQFGQKLHTDEKGQFPCDFVKPIALPKLSPTETLLYALDAFYPEAEGDLPFNKGDFIILESKINDEWGNGRCSSTSDRGIFPLNYTNILFKPADKCQLITRKTEGFTKDTSHLSDASVQGQVKAKAIMNLNAQLDEELSFMIGDEITILEVTDNGTWYKGQLGSSIGTFPAAFVQLVTPLNGSITTNGRETPSKLHFMRTRSKSWKQEELDDVVQNMDAGKPNESTTISSRLGKTSRTKADIIAMIKNDPVSMDGTTQRHNGLLASNKTTNTRTVKNMSNNDIDTKQSVQDGIPPEPNDIVPESISYTVKAVHKYTKNTERELSFDIGDEIPIYEEVDEHWLIGQIGMKKGYIARAYVTKASDSTVSEKHSRRTSETVQNKPRLVDTVSKTSEISQVKKTGDILINKNHVYSAPGDSVHSGTARSKIKGTRLHRKAQAMYDYHATKRFDLTVTCGEIVWVTKDVDENWVEVKNEKGKKGIVPVEFLEYYDDFPPQKDSKNSDGNNQRRTIGDDVKSYLYDKLSKCDNNSESAPTPNEPSMPVLRENTVEPSLRFENHQAVKYSTSRIPSSLPIDETDSQSSQSSLKKSISVDSYPIPSQTNRDVIVNRSNSNPQKNITAKDAREILIAWCASRRTSTPSTSGSTKNDDGETSSTSSEATSSRKSSFTRGSSRSLSMREKRTRRRKPETTSKDTSFLKQHTDSDLHNEALLKRERHRTVTGVKTTAQYEQEYRSNRKSSPLKTKHVDSLSIASTGSSSSYGEVRNSRSGNSDLSDSQSRSSTSSRKSAHRTVPSIPLHTSDTATAPDKVSYTFSTWSPPIPPRKQSLPVRHSLSTTTAADTPPPPPDVSLIPTRSTSYTPLRPAPEIPKSKSQPSLKSFGSVESSPQKKMPPTRPANPPRSRNIHTKGSQNSQEKVRRVTPKVMKSRIEKIRSDIEDYSRMKTDLESLYQSTLDGRERRDISENMEFVKANLRRLQKEFQNLIDGEQDHIYESVELYMQPRPSPNETTEELQKPPTLPPVPKSPRSIKEKRVERRLRVVKELVDTERIFLNDVTITVEDIMNELIDRQVSQTTISTLFANIIQVKEFSERLLKQLEEALQNESSEYTDLNDTTVGQVFIDCNLEMKEIYTPYYRNHDDAMTHLEVKLKEDAEFSQIVQHCLESIKSKVNVFNLGSFLIKPVQRFLKYPLLIEELIKLTDKSTAECPTDQDKLILAHKMMQTIAKEINEDKRIKDLVRKYKDGSNEGISEKLSKLNLKSIKKKSTRISKKLGIVTGISTQGSRDAQFDTVERRFKIMERAAKLFIHNVTSYCDKCRDVLCAEVVVASAMIEIVNPPESSATHPVAMLKSMTEKMSTQSYRNFHDKVQLEALSPISALLISFKSPQAIIDKRRDKLIDYESLQKHSDSKEKIEAAKHDYEALNKSLIDELPKLCDLGLKLLTSCTAIFARVHRDFESKLMLELDPLLSMIQRKSDKKYDNNMEILEKFKPDFKQAVETISRLSVIPAAFGTMLGNTGTSKFANRQLTKSPQKRLENNLTLKQPVDDRESLQRKYGAQNLYVASKNYNASQVADLSCCEGDVVAVLKQSDPMGSKERWFVDRGGPGNSTGFLPATVLKEYDPSCDSAAALSPPPIHRNSLSVENSPTPKTRQFSPTPSLKSQSSEDSGSGFTRRLSVSPHMVREKIRSGSMLSKDDGSLYTEEDLMNAFAEEEELLDDIYGDADYPGPGQKSVKQHLRAEYDFNARSEIELSLKAGNIVSLIVSHDTEGNPDWWFVRNADGRQGYVPANYLTKAEYL